MKIAQLSMKTDHQSNPLKKVSWKDASAKKKSEVYSIMARVNDSRM